MKAQIKPHLIYSSTLIIIGLSTLVFLLLFILKDPFKLYILFQKHIKEFLFLILTGHFLYILRYEIMGTPITFNALIIYISNSILKGYHFKGVELVYLFILVYFASQLLIHLIFDKITLALLETALMRIVMWSILIYIFNKLTITMKIDIENLVEDIIFIPLIALLHFFTKFLFMTGERFLQKRYYSFSRHTLPYLVIDSILIYFSIIIGSVFGKIGLISTALFISFLAIVLSLTNYISKREFTNYQFFSLHSFLKARALYFKDDSYPFIPIYKTRRLTNLLPPSIEQLTFLTFSNKSLDFNKIVLDDNEQLLWGESSFFRANRHSITTILINKSESQIEELKRKLEKLTAAPLCSACCSIERAHWEQININNIFRILLFEVKKRKNPTDIIYIKQNYILL